MLASRATQEMISAILLSRFACSFCSSLIRTISNVLTISQAATKFDVPATLSIARGLESITAYVSNCFLVDDDRSPPESRWFKSSHSASEKERAVVMCEFSTYNVMWTNQSNSSRLAYVVLYSWACHASSPV